VVNWLKRGGKKSNSEVNNLLKREIGCRNGTRCLLKELKMTYTSEGIGDQKRIRYMAPGSIPLYRFFPQILCPVPFFEASINQGNQCGNINKECPQHVVNTGITLISVIDDMLRATLRRKSHDHQEICPIR
jgi:hypothetical protein